MTVNGPMSRHSMEPEDRGRTKSKENQLILENRKRAVSEHLAHTGINQNHQVKAKIVRSNSAQRSSSTKSIPYFPQNKKQIPYAPPQLDFKALHYTSATSNKPPPPPPDSISPLTVLQDKYDTVRPNTSSGLRTNVYEKIKHIESEGESEESSEEEEDEEPEVENSTDEEDTMGYEDDNFEEDVNEIQDLLSKFNTKVANNSSEKPDTTANRSMKKILNLKDLYNETPTTSAGDYAWKIQNEMIIADYTNIRRFSSQSGGVLGFINRLHTKST
ncbi:hypothetical protein G210_5028 [Candida maltosa Xu316]|uniref:Uncharacterized protein n=1 Tax=Candida maltosa (strain Xu316) TaxID=1245528 RepID=M3K3X2_CANMX|nr:hypothetical protein G210_5028 [Candida maltosa Xu316]